MSNQLLEVSAKDVANRFGFYTDEAMQRPVGIQRHGTTRIVMISLTEYERLKRRDREAVRNEALAEGTLNVIFTAETPEEAERLNRLMDDSAAD